MINLLCQQLHDFARGPLAIVSLLSRYC